MYPAQDETPGLLVKQFRSVPIIRLKQTDRVNTVDMFQSTFTSQTAAVQIQSATAFPVARTL